MKWADPLPTVSIMTYRSARRVEFSTQSRSGRQSFSTLFQNDRHFSILLFTCKLALVPSFKGKYSFEFQVYERGNKGLLASKQKNTKMAAILE